jgi:hypothetical protein
MGDVFYWRSCVVREMDCFQIQILFRQRGEVCIAGQCRTNPCPAVPDWPWCRNADAGLSQSNTGRNADAETTFFPAFLLMIFQHHITSITPAAVVYMTSRVYVSLSPLESVYKMPKCLQCFWLYKQCCEVVKNFLPQSSPKEPKAPQS